MSNLDNYEAALANASRGHRSYEWEDACGQLSLASKAYVSELREEYNDLRTAMQALADDWSNQPHPEGAESIQDWVYRTHVSSLGAILRGVLDSLEDKQASSAQEGDKVANVNWPDEYAQAPAEQRHIGSTFPTAFGMWAWQCSCNAIGSGYSTNDSAISGFHAHLEWRQANGL